MLMEGSTRAEDGAVCEGSLLREDKVRAEPDASAVKSTAGAEMSMGAASTESTGAPATATEELVGACPRLDEEVRGSSAVTVRVTAAAVGEAPDTIGALSVADGRPSVAVSSGVSSSRAGRWSTNEDERR